MSVPGFPTDPETANPIYEFARTAAKERFARHWSEWNFNLWTTYNTEINQTWWDPWFEHEIAGIDNFAPNYEMTQNMYGIYNWLSYKGYSRYAATALITSVIQSSTVTGGLWEEGLSPYNASGFPNSAIGFDANSRAGNFSRGNWYQRGVIATWTAYAQDDEQGTQVSLTASPGSWYAVKKWPIKMDPDAAAVGMRVPVYPLRFDTDAAPAGYEPDNVGYGLVQWTPYTLLPTKASLIPDVTDGGRHWQCNLTLQLMIQEFERAHAMSGEPQNVSSYLGEWVDANATSAYIEKDMGGGDIRVIHYPSSCTWDYWAADSPLAIFRDHMYNTVGVYPSQWDLRHIMMDIYRVCYIHSGYRDFDFKDKSLYVFNALKYWDENGGYDVKDIPRARDIDYCELDRFHVNPSVFALLAGRKKGVKGVRTVLFQ